MLRHRRPCSGSNRRPSPRPWTCASPWPGLEKTSRLMLIITTKLLSFPRESPVAFPAAPRFGGGAALLFDMGNREIWVCPPRLFGRPGPLRAFVPPWLNHPSPSLCAQACFRSKLRAPSRVPASEICAYGRVGAPVVASRGFLYAHEKTGPGSDSGCCIPSFSPLRFWLTRGADRAKAESSAAEQKTRGT